MKVICKTFPKNVNGIERTFDPNITINKSYTVLSYKDEKGNHNINKNDTISLKELRMLTIIGNIGKCFYWSDYFYNEKELRLLKLKKLYNVNKE